MTRRKTILVITGSAAAVGAAAIIGLGTVGAASQPGGLANAIASHFHLNASDVQGVIDQNHSQNQAQAEQRYEQHLQQLVDQGKITSAQKDLILAKHKEVLQFMQSLEGKSPQDRRTALQQERTSLQQWAQQNNIPLQYVMPGRGMGVHRGMMGGQPPQNQ